MIINAKKLFMSSMTTVCLKVCSSLLFIFLKIRIACCLLTDFVLYIYTRIYRHIYRYFCQMYVLVVKGQPASAGDIGDLGSIPESGRSPREGNSNPLQYSCLENPWTEVPGGLQSMGSQRVRHD